MVLNHGHVKCACRSMLRCDCSALVWFTQGRNRDNKPQLSLFSLPMVGAALRAPAPSG